MDQITLVRRYHTTLIGLRDRTGAAVGKIWDSVGGLDDAALEAFQASAARAVLGGQLATVRLADAYLMHYMALATHTPPRPTGLDPASVTGTAVRNGTTAEEVYARSVVTARGAISRGADFTDAIARGRARAVSSAETDVMLANRAAATEIMGADERIRGYERVLDGRACLFCAAASTQVYHSGDLLPLHDRCGCTVAPIIGSSNPGKVLNRQLLADLKEQGGSKYWTTKGEVADDGSITVFGDDGKARPLEVAVEQHGELGPVLTDASHAFTGPHDI